MRDWLTKIQTKAKDLSETVQSNAVLRVIGDRAAGKTTYMASLARWPNADPSSPVQTVTAINEEGSELVTKAQNILEQGLELEPTRLEIKYMTESTTVEIHEFSTGIHYQGTANNWVSLGFTGQYMNKTIKEIPYAVERSIANKEFAVAEGASSDQPAVIGRVVGSGDSAWSVVAIVTRGRDEKGRSASLYRYFLCAKDDSLPKILAWIEEYRRRYGQIPVFDPFEKKEVGQQNISTATSSQFQDLNETWSAGILPATTSREQDAPTTTSREKDAPTTTSREQDAPTTTSREQDAPTTTSREQDAPTTTSREQDAPTTTSREQDAPTTTSREQDAPTTTSREQDAPTTTSREQDAPTTTSREQDAPTTTSREQDAPTTVKNDTSENRYGSTPETQSRPERESTSLLILTGQEYTLKDLYKINKLATEKAKGQPIAWAFNVEALEQIRGFQIIQAASDKAYELLQKAKMNMPQLPVPVVADEQAIKSAIKGLINSSTAKPEYVEVIANSLENTLITENYWRDIFDGQGADKALRQGLYTDQFVRLLMLRAIVIPKTLPEYLAWLEKVNQQNEPYKLAAEFDSQLSKSLKHITTTVSNFKNNICQGFEVLIFSLLDGKVSSESAKKLLFLKNGLWRNFSRPLIDDLDTDLKLMSQFAYGKNINFMLKDNKWQNVRHELKLYWQRNYTCKPNHKYLPLAEIFGNLSHPNLSAFFYQIGYGKVPKKIFDKLHSRSFNTDVYELEVERELTIPEFFVLKVIELWDNYLPVEIVFLLIVVSLLGFFAVIKLPIVNSYLPKMKCEFAGYLNLEKKSKECS